jgi:hypothetical protein
MLVQDGKGEELNMVLEWSASDLKPDGIEVSMIYTLRTGTDMSDLDLWLLYGWLAEALEKRP